MKNKEKKIAFMDWQLFEELKNLNNQNETRKFYRKINIGKKEFKPSCNMCRNKNGNPFHEEEEILDTQKTLNN